MGYLRITWHCSKWWAGKSHAKRSWKPQNSYLNGLKSRKRSMESFCKVATYVNATGTHWISWKAEFKLKAYIFSSLIKKFAKCGTQASSNVCAEQEPHLIFALQQRARICCLDMQVWELHTTNPGLHGNKVCVPIFAKSRTNTTASTTPNPHSRRAWKLLFQPQKIHVYHSKCALHHNISMVIFFPISPVKCFLNLSAWSIYDIVREKQLSSPALFEERKLKEHF